MTSDQPAVKQFQFFPLLINLLITLGIGISASFFTRPQIATWYLFLHKPAFTPPAWLFGPVWTLLYIMMAVAAYIIWKRRSIAPNYQCSKASYIIQLILNFLWSLTFFGLHEVFLAFMVILLLLVGIGFNIYYFARIYKAAAWLLVPYLCWVGYATALNLSIYLLN